MSVPKKIKRPNQEQLSGRLSYKGLVSNDSDFIKSNPEMLAKFEVEIRLFSDAISKIVHDHGRKVSVITSLEFID